MSVRARSVPCARKIVTKDVENTVESAIVSLGNEGQGLHLAINNFIQKQSYALII